MAYRNAKIIWKQGSNNIHLKTRILALRLSEMIWNYQKIRMTVSLKLFYLYSILLIITFF